MLEVKLKGGTVKQFNLKNFEREKVFKDAWKSMKDDETYKQKALKVTTSDGKVLFYEKVVDIVDCFFDEAIFCEGEVLNKY